MRERTIISWNVFALLFLKNSIFDMHGPRHTKELPVSCCKPEFIVNAEDSQHKENWKEINAAYSRLFPFSFTSAVPYFI